MSCPPSLGLRLAWTVLVLAAATPAQTCAVRNTYRLVNSYSGALSELNVDTGWLTTAPVSVPGVNGNPGATCRSQGSCAPTADYGALRVVGTGSATNCATSGVFLVLDQGPQARFRDAMTVASTTLPNGTPVQVRITLTLGGYAAMFDSSPNVTSNATLNAGALHLVVDPGPGVATGIVNTQVGATTSITGDLSTTLYAYGLLNLGMPPVTSNYAVDLSARVAVECLTAGAALTFCSGRSYQTVAASVVPVGGGCGAGSPVLVATLPLLGQNQDYDLAQAAANSLVYLGLALGPGLGRPFGSCVVTEDSATLVLLAVGATDGAGALRFAQAIPSSPTLVGQQFTGQALVLRAGGPLLGIAQLSNGLTSTIGR